MWEGREREGRSGEMVGLEGSRRSEVRGMMLQSKKTPGQAI